AGDGDRVRAPALGRDRNGVLPERDEPIVIGDAVKAVRDAAWHVGNHRARESVLLEHVQFLGIEELDRLEPDGLRLAAQGFERNVVVTPPADGVAHASPQCGGKGGSGGGEWRGEGGGGRQQGGAGGEEWRAG